MWGVWGVVVGLIQHCLIKSSETMEQMQFIRIFLYSVKFLRIARKIDQFCMQMFIIFINLTFGKYIIYWTTSESTNQ